MAHTVIPFDEKRESGWSRMQERRAWEYYPQYASEAEIEKITGKRKKFPQALRDRFYNDARMEDVGIESEWHICVSLDGNEGRVSVWEKGLEVEIGRYTGDSGAHDVNNLRKMPVLVRTFEEAVEYLRAHHKRMA